MTTREDYSAFSVEELKEKLRVLNAKTSGNKLELIRRLMEIDPMNVRTGARLAEGTPEYEEGASRENEANDVNEMASMRRELELSRKEQEIAKKEL